MKKAVAVLAFLLIALLLAGCTENAAIPHNVNEAAHYEASATKHEELRDDAVVPAAAGELGEALSSTRFFLLDYAEAKNIALQQAGVTAEDVTCFSIELDDGDGHGWEYEIGFCVGDVEYDIELNAETGAVLESHTERDSR